VPDAVPLREHLQRQLDDLRAMLDERYRTQSAAIDKAFQAQQLAMQTALEAAERAVDRALLAAEKAVIKAETASDKRFEGVNAFRATLADQQSTFISRAEALAATDRNAERINDLTDRMNRSEGKGTGLQHGWTILVGAFGLISTSVALFLALKGH
jgi:hypothetical protein